MIKELHFATIGDSRKHTEVRCMRCCLNLGNLQGLFGPTLYYSWTRGSFSVNDEYEFAKCWPARLVGMACFVEFLLCPFDVWGWDWEGEAMTKQNLYPYAEVLMRYWKLFYNKMNQYISLKYNKIDEILKLLKGNLSLSLIHVYTWAYIV